MAETLMTAGLILFVKAIKLDIQLIQPKTN
jgi:hypothetical protein